MAAGTGPAGRGRPRLPRHRRPGFSRPRSPGQGRPRLPRHRRPGRPRHRSPGRGRPRLPRHRRPGCCGCCTDATDRCASCTLATERGFWRSPGRRPRRIVARDARRRPQPATTGARSSPSCACRKASTAGPRRGASSVGSLRLAQAVPNSGRDLAFRANGRPVPDPTALWAWRGPGRWRPPHVAPWDGRAWAGLGGPLARAGPMRPYAPGGPYGVGTFGGMMSFWPL